jgi:hypothetical protein
MARDVGGFEEAKRIQSSMEKRESGADSSGPAPTLKEPYPGGKTQPTFSSFKKPSMGTVRKHME